MLLFLLHEDTIVLILRTWIRFNLIRIACRSRGAHTRHTAYTIVSRPDLLGQMTIANEWRLPGDRLNLFAVHFIHSLCIRISICLFENASINRSDEPEEECTNKRGSSSWLLSKSLNQMLQIRLEIVAHTLHIPMISFAFDAFDPEAHCSRCTNRSEIKWRIIECVLINKYYERLIGISARISVRALEFTLAQIPMGKRRMNVDKHRRATHWRCDKQRIMCLRTHSHMDSCRDWIDRVLWNNVRDRMHSQTTNPSVLLCQW